MATPTEPLKQYEVMKALAHPLRLEILEALDGQAASPNELSQQLGQPLGNVSYHMRQLADLGLVVLDSTAQRRGAVEHYYRLAERPVITDDIWGRMPSSMKNSIIRTVLRDVAGDINRAAEIGAFEQDDIHLTRTPVVLDAKGRRDLRAATDRLQARAAQIEEQAAQRIKADPHAEAEAHRLILMLFPTPRRKRRT